MTPAECAWKRSRFRLTVLSGGIAIAAVLTVSASGQAQTAIAPGPSFDAAAIRVNADPGKWEENHLPPGRFEVKHATLRSLIATAWELKEEGLVTGGPGWIDEQRFDIEATMPEAEHQAIAGLSEEQQRYEVHLMLRSLLAERFQLSVRQHPAEVKGLALAIAKGGSKLRPAGSASASDRNASSAYPSPSISFTSVDAPLGDLVGFLAKIFRRPVIDETGLTGRYDMKQIVIPFDPQMEGPGAETILALQEQLGLTLKAEKMPAEGVAVEHVERLSEN